MRDEIKTYARCTLDTQFHVFEILEIAEEVESKAAQFYRHAAERFADDERRRLCHDLADWRTEHRDVWQCLRRRYTERTGEFGAFDPNNYVLSNPQVMAGLAGFRTGPRGYRWPTRYDTREQILQDALRKSQGIIIFYHGLKEFARGPDSRLMIDNIISEEDRQVHLLMDALEQIQPSPEDFDDPTSLATPAPTGV